MQNLLQTQNLSFHDLIYFFVLRDLLACELIQGSKFLRNLRDLREIK